MLHCIALDDEPLALDVLKEYAVKEGSEIAINAFTSSVQATEYLKNTTVDLIFLDIELAGVNGINFYESLANKPMVIFTSAYSEYAIDGFNVEAIDYLLKPFESERFNKAITRAKEALKFRLKKENEEVDYITVRSDYELKKIQLNDILYIQGLSDYVKIYTTLSAKPIITLMTMKDIAARLPAKRFVRIHRSFIVSFPQIKSFNARYVDACGKKFPVGDTYRSMLKVILNH
jgi:DNA-binding LytR/AlgR family response regulator